MWFLIGVTLSASLFLLFRTFSRYQINTFQAIVVNYFTCVVTGLFYIGDFSAIQSLSWHHEWVSIPFWLGVLFISTFYLMSYVAQNVSVSASSVATKISLIIPVLFNLLFLNKTQSFTVLNYIGLGLVFVAIVLTSYQDKKAENKDTKSSRWGFLYILLIFLMSGTIDTSINWVSKHAATDTTSQAVFSVLIFVVASFIGGSILAYQIIMRKTKFQWKNIGAGMLLGVVNYFSIIFMIKSLKIEFLDNGAFFFPVFNISIILFSTFFALFFFKEKLNKQNKWGIMVAIMAIFCISYQAITNFLGQ